MASPLAAVSSPLELWALKVDSLPTTKKTWANMGYRCLGWGVVEWTKPRLVYYPAQEGASQGSTGGSTINHNLAFFNLTGKAPSDQMDVNIITD